MKRMLLAGLCSISFGLPLLYSMELNKEFVKEECKGKEVQKKLLKAIRHRKYSEFCNLLQNPEAFFDEDFLNVKIGELLFHQNSYVRGLAFLALFELSKHGYKFDPMLFTLFEKSATFKGLNYVVVEEDKSCNVEIKVLGDHENNSTNVGLAIAISAEGGVSNALHRDLLDEHYFIMAGEVDVAMREKNGAEWKVTHGKPGDYIFIPRKVHVQFKNAGKGKLIMLVPTTPSYGSIAKKTPVEVLLDPKDGCWDKKGDRIKKD
jgi:mannose-6-phosphate isomerase-like protein (cupin superfamily)